MKSRFNFIWVITIIAIYTFAFILILNFQSCHKEGWIPGTPLPKEKLKIGVIHINDPFAEHSGYSYAHEMGIQEMQKNIGLENSNITRKINVFDGEPGAVEEAIRDCIAEGANIIIATSFSYMETCERLAREFPSVIFAHASGSKHNDTNFTNYFGRVYQAKYLSGIIAGMKTKTGKIGFVAPWGLENSEVTCSLNAFARGVERVNPQARIYIKITYNWFDPLGETIAARSLISEGCDIITQETDSPASQIEAEKAGVWGIGYNTDMSADAPAAVLTSVLWQWGAYYTSLVRSVIDGTFTSTPWYGSLKDGIVDLAPLSEIIRGEPEISSLLEEERRRIETGEFDVFSGVMETNDGRSIGREGENLSDYEIRNGINWYYRNVIVMR